MVKSFSSREVIGMLENDGWSLVRTRGDHRAYKHPHRRDIVTVTHPVKDIPIGTLRSVFRRAGWQWPPQ